MKKVKPTITVMCFLSAMVLGGFYYKTARAQEQIDQAPHASGFGTEGGRIDSQVTLKVPEGHADAVYNYLRSKYRSRENNNHATAPGSSFGRARNV